MMLSIFSCAQWPFVDLVLYFLLLFKSFLFLKNILKFILAAPGLSCGTWDLRCGMRDFQLRHAGFLLAACRLFSGSMRTLSCGMWTSQLQHVCRIQFPDQGSNPGPLHWEHGVLPTGPPGKSLFKSFAHFLVGLFVSLLLSCKSYLYILILDPYQICDLQIFSPISPILHFSCYLFTILFEFIQLFK